MRDEVAGLANGTSRVELHVELRKGVIHDTASNLFVRGGRPLKEAETMLRPDV